MDIGSTLHSWAVFFQRIVNCRTWCTHVPAPLQAPIVLLNGVLYVEEKHLSLTWALFLHSSSRECTVTCLYHVFHLCTYEVSFATRVASFSFLWKCSNIFMVFLFWGLNCTHVPAPLQAPIVLLNGVLYVEDRHLYHLPRGLVSSNQFLWTYSDIPHLHNFKIWLLILFLHMMIIVIPVWNKMCGQRTIWYILHL